VPFIKLRDLGWKEHWDLLAATAILLAVLVLKYGFTIELPSILSIITNAIAYVLAGREVLQLAFRKSLRGDFFNEFVLMSVATIGAFIIGEYEEGVAVMVFYQIGEWFQDAAVDNAKRSIKALLDIRPDEVTVLRNEKVEVVNPASVKIGETIQVKPGEKVALDGNLLSDKASFNTAALTGESTPDSKYKGDKVFAGMINLNTVAQIQVNAAFKDSKLSQILEMVQNATARKSETQLFISRFAKVYTPIVFFLALAVCVVPYFVVSNYDFYTWFYRSLVFLVISCPCALVVSIPLGYFGGIGLASRNGILFKGGNYLDVMTQIDTVVMDKTGTLTKGVFKVQQIVPEKSSKEELLRITAALERHSTHPIAKAITMHVGNSYEKIETTSIEEISGHGLRGTIGTHEVLAGNAKLLTKYGIQFPNSVNAITDTVVLIAIDNLYAGHITIADEVKEDAKQAIEQLHKMNIKTVMLSGDKQAVVDKVANELLIEEAYGSLLPEDKVARVQQLKDQGAKLAFVGDGVNDAPVVALADAGIAMGGLGSDATIETADIIIQNDQPSKIPAAIRCGKITRNIVWQNIILAMAVKLIVLALGAGGVATLWEAVIADVGVALLAIVNAVRIQRINLE
jgi:Zn2+/Cd2+-exporting ATPase